jgi:TonB-linked SusC/RagA family outer membrane protein
MKHRTYKNKLLAVFFSGMCVCTLSTAQTTEEDTISVKNQAPTRQIAYQTQPAWMVTSAVSSVSGEELRKSFASNFANTLYGRLPGLTMLQGGQEAGVDSPSLFSRGVGTFGRRDMLIIVDGFESMFEQLVPEEVESVTLLKDAAATAMYGRRGANGVLLITTKRGKEGPLKVNFSVQQGFEGATRLPDFVGSYDYARLYNEALTNDGLPTQYTDEDLNAYKTGSDPYFHPDVDWYDQILRDYAPVGKYSLSFSGGQSKVRYFVLLNILNRGGLYKKTEHLSDNTINSDYTQYNIRTKVDIDITRRFSAAFNLGLAIADKSTSAGWDAGGMFWLMSMIPPNAFPVYNPNNTYGGNALYTNPWANMVETGFYKRNTKSTQTSLKFTEQLDMIARGLSVSAAVSFNTISRGSSAKTRNYKRFSISREESGDTTYVGFGEPTSLAATEWQEDLWRNVTFQSSLDYDRSFGHNRLSGILLYNLDTYTLPGNSLNFKHVGLGGRLAYSNREKYIGEISFGYNGANGFARGKRFELFPAVSVGWIASNEEFLKENKLLSYLKLRASYGLVGNDLPGGERFMYEQFYQGDAGYAYGTTNMGVGGYAEAMIANPDLTCEKKKELNIGIEAVLLERLEIGLDLFNQDRFDILAAPYKTVPQFLGVIYPMQNVGKVNNKGFEAKLGYHSDPVRNFQYFAEANVWFAKNKIEYTPETAHRYEYQYATGRRIWQPWYLEAIGFFKDQADIQNSPRQTFAQVQPGDIKYKDQNGDNVIDQNDYYPIGHSGLPELTCGLRAGLKYKSLYLDLLFQGVARRWVYLSGPDFQALQSKAKIPSLALERWTSSTAESATYPRLSAQDNLNNFQGSTFWTRDGSFIKLRSAELGIDLPQTIVEKVRLSSAKIFINGTNLFSWDHVDIADPETLGGYPAVRTVSLGAKIQL